MENKTASSINVFEKLKTSILNIDPVNFCENYLTLDGNPFRVRGNGYKPFVDIYRYIGLKALSKKALPIVLVKGRQVGATTMGVNLELFWMGCGMFGTEGRPPIRVAHCFPQLDIATYYSKSKLSPGINSSKQIKCEDGKYRSFMSSIINSFNSESIYSKMFNNDNMIAVDSIGVNADRVRGRTYDIMFFDEVQDMFPRAIMNALKTLAQSKYGPNGQGVQVYMGTPKAKDSKYYEMWTASTKSYYHLGCSRCGKHFPLYTPNSDAWEKIWLDEDDERCAEFHPDNRGHIVECVHCGKTQDKREAAERGKWVHSVSIDDLDENGKPIAKYIGFHINQLYMPLYSKKNILDQKPENNPLSDETAWNNEVLGEFYSGDSSTITAEQIRTACGDYERPMVKTIRPSECTNERDVYLGIDWGKKVDAAVKNKEGVVVSKGQSYTVACVIKVEGPKLFSIQFATKLKDNSLTYKREVIDQIMTNYNVKRAVGDIGYGHEIMGELQNQYGLRVLASEALGTKIKGRIKFDDVDSPKTIRFEKDNQIEEFIKLLQKGSVRFPMRSWEQIAWLVSHCSSMVAKPVGDRYGNVKLRYSKGISPNDGLMALINAYLAYKFDVTNGFKNNAKLFSDKPNDRSKGTAIGVYCPAMKIVG